MHTLTPRQAKIAARRACFAWRPDDGERANGAIVYRGPSAVDGAPIVVILIGLDVPSANGKTGGLVQSYILREDIAPLAAMAQGLDVSICGDCPHRHPRSGGSGACYVNVGQGATGVWKGLHRGIYPTLGKQAAMQAVAATGRGLRVGTYGDPAAVPAPERFWRPLTDAARFGRACAGNVTGPDHTAYTHAAHLKRGASLRGLCMASADSSEERDAFRSKGWATFRVAPAGEKPSDRNGGEAHCPASEEAGRKTTCEGCPIGCNGAGLSVVIPAHGSQRSNFEEANRAA